MGKIAKFVQKTQALLAENPHLVAWNEDGTVFRILDVERFAKEVLPKYFSHNNMGSFKQQLRGYNFERNEAGTEFSHPNFMRDRADLLSQVTRTYVPVPRGPRLGKAGATAEAVSKVVVEEASREESCTRDVDAKMEEEIRVLKRKRDEMEGEVERLRADDGDLQRRMELLREQQATMRQQYDRQCGALAATQALLRSLAGRFPAAASMLATTQPEEADDDRVAKRRCLVDPITGSGRVWGIGGKAAPSSIRSRGRGVASRAERYVAKAQQSALAANPVSQGGVGVVPETTIELAPRFVDVTAAVPTLEMTEFIASDNIDDLFNLFVGDAEPDGGVSSMDSGVLDVEAMLGGATSASVNKSDDGDLDDIVDAMMTQDDIFKIVAELEGVLQVGCI